MRDFHIAAFKRYDQNSFVSCPVHDTAASKFCVSYPGMPFSSSTIDFDTLFQAQEIMRALNAAFEAGKSAKLRELRNFLGLGPS